MPAETHSFKPTLGLTDATMIVAGSMIGSGIFLVSADIVRNVGGAGWLILVWVITGFMTLTAAVSYGELSGMFPKAGGQYVYLKEAYNPLVSFLYGWSLFSVIQTGTIAAVGVAFSKYAAYLIPALSEDNLLVRFQTGTNTCGDPVFFKVSSAQIVSILLIGFLTYTNTRGVKGSKWIQNIFTSTKLQVLLHFTPKCGTQTGLLPGLRPSPASKTPAIHH
jgi:APA family basic amino acid/polyamine antiporter